MFNLKLPFRLRCAALLTICALLTLACAENSTIDRIREQIANEATTTTTSTPNNSATEPNDPSASDRSAPPPPAIDPTPIPIDAQYRIDTLENGLTYLLRSNDSPGSNLEIRLLVNAGSAQQVDGSDGSAHFLEHMLFNGTEKYPGNELTAQLQSLGIAFGADVNAYTSFDETVYLLSADTSADTAVETAFDVLAQWASAATIEEAAVLAERGVVRDELRQRLETVDGIISNEFNKVYVANTPYEGHLIAGQADKIERTTATNLRAFYNDWYRPDNMAVVAVGEMALDDLEALVIKHFADLQPRTANPPAREKIEIEILATPQAHVVTHPDNSLDNLSLDFPIPASDESSLGGSRLRLMEQAIVIMLNNRLNDAYQTGELVLEEPPYLIDFEVNRALRYFGTNLKATDLAKGLNDYMAYLIAAAENGFSAEEMLRMRQTMQTIFDQQLTTINTIQDATYADLLSRYWLQGADLDKTQSRIARQRTLIESLTAQDLTNHWSWLLSISGPIVIAVGANAATLPTTTELLETLADLKATPSATTSSQIDQLMQPLTGVEPISTSERSSDNGEVTIWTFGNGVTVSHRQTDVAENSVSLRAASFGGWSTFPRDHIAANEAVPAVAVAAVLGSGVGPHDALTLDRFLSTKNLHIVAHIDLSSEGFSAQSASADAEDLFALLHLYISKPRVDSVAFRTAIDEAERNLAEHQTHVDRRALATLIDLIYDGDAAFQRVATQDQLDSLTAQSSLEIYQARLGKVDDLAVSIVGDISRNEVAELAARYLGTLPAQPQDSWVDLGVELPTGRKSASVELSAGTTDGGLFVFHAQPTEVNAQTRVTANLLQGIVNNRITERIREELGASYGGSASITFQRNPRPSIRSFISISGDPTRLDEIRSVLTTELETLATRGPTTNQFAQAHNVIRSDWNFYNNIVLANEDLDAIRYPNENRLTTDNRLELLSNAVAAEVQKLAALLYGGGNWLEVAKVLPG
ncbi:MAG: insulinase family protein [Acidimicrobiaceae bacterium]|nr:insulinase family protein [Acidimicrobiaceae bacterium]